MNKFIIAGSQVPGLEIHNWETTGERAIPGKRGVGRSREKAGRERPRRTGGRESGKTQRSFFESTEWSTLISGGIKKNGPKIVLFVYFRRREYKIYKYYLFILRDSRKWSIIVDTESICVLLRWSGVVGRRRDEEVYRAGWARERTDGNRGGRGRTMFLSRCLLKTVSCRGRGPKMKDCVASIFSYSGSTGFFHPTISFTALRFASPFDSHSLSIS